jgi:putative polyhydroxyalkanoate system protein
VADLHILRQHTLGMADARKVAFKWAEHAEEELGMRCIYEEGTTVDEVCFTRAGVHGTLSVTKDKFELQAKLGFLVGAFKARIESEITKNLDELLTPKPKPRAHAKPHVSKDK